MIIGFDATGLVCFAREDLTHASVAVGDEATAVGTAIVPDDPAIAGHPTGYMFDVANGLRPRIGLSADRSELIADGLDAVTAVATVPTDELVRFVVNQGTPIDVQAIAGQAILQVVATSPGDITIEAQSPSVYGSNAITLVAR